MEREEEDGENWNGAGGSGLRNETDSNRIQLTAVHASASASNLKHPACAPVAMLVTVVTEMGAVVNFAEDTVPAETVNSREE